MSYLIQINYKNGTSVLLSCSDFGISVTVENIKVTATFDNNADKWEELMNFSSGAICQQFLFLNTDEIQSVYQVRSEKF